MIISRHSNRLLTYLTVERRGAFGSSNSSDKFAKPQKTCRSVKGVEMMLWLVLARAGVAHSNRSSDFKITFTPLLGYDPWAPTN
jgi:hypothetical protein